MPCCDADTIDEVDNFSRKENQTPVQGADQDGVGEKGCRGDPLRCNT